MRRIILAIVAAIALSACDPVTVQQANQTAASAIDAARKVQGYARTICAFEPTVASVLKLFNAAYGMTLDAVAGAICNAATSIPLADGGTRKIVVNGVQIKGRRIVSALR